MRLAISSAALIIAASLAASSAAQNAQQNQDEVFVEGMTACASMFSERHPAAGPPPFPPSSDPFNDNGYGKERAIAYGFKPLPVDDLAKAGWGADPMLPGQSRSPGIVKRGAWGRAMLRPSDLSCSFSMFALPKSLLDADLVLATATSWVAATYPGASVTGEVETLDERLKGPVGGVTTALKRTQWKSSDGMRVSLSITRPYGQQGAIIVSVLMNYLPTKPQPAIPQGQPP